MRRQGAKVLAALAREPGPAASVVDVARVEPEPLTDGSAVRLRMMASTVNPSDWSAVVPTTDAGWPGEVRRLSGRSGVDVAFDCVGGEHAAALLGAIRPGGSLVHYGLLSGRPLSAESIRAHPDRQIHLFRLRNLVHSSPRDRIQALLDRSYRGILTGPFRTSVSATLPLRQIRQLLDEAGTADGKLLITFP